jgi:hypothetical protein
MARLAQSEEVPVPPFALRKTMSKPFFPFSLLVLATSTGVSAPNIRIRLSSRRDIACADLIKYSSTPAFRQASLRSGLGSEESAIREV